MQSLASADAFEGTPLTQVCHGCVFATRYGLAEVVLTCTGHDPHAPQEPTLLRLDKRGLETQRRAIDVDASGRAIKLQDSDSPATTSADGVETVEIIGCGYAMPSQEVAVVDAGARALLDDDRVGEIWVSSKSVSVGYVPAVCRWVPLPLILTHAHAHVYVHVHTRARSHTHTTTTKPCFIALLHFGLDV